MENQNKQQYWPNMCFEKRANPWFCETDFLFFSVPETVSISFEACQNDSCDPARLRKMHLSTGFWNYREKDDKFEGFLPTAKLLLI